MKHECKYCRKEFEGNAGAKTCSTTCRAAYNHVKQFAAVWGVTLPNTADNLVKQPEPTKPQEQPKTEPKTVIQPTVKPITGQTKQDKLAIAAKIIESASSSERWEHAKAFKKRHNFD